MAGILIVDDDPTIRGMFARALKPLGDIEQAANGAEALRLLGARRFGVVLLDLHMPVIDGFVILHTLAGKPGPNRDTPIYVITADTSDQARIRALRRHAVFLLTKPVPIATLTALVDATLKKAAARALTGTPETAEAHDAVTAEAARTEGSSPAASKPARVTPAVRPVVSEPQGGSRSPIAAPKKPG